METEEVETEDVETEDVATDEESDAVDFTDFKFRGQGQQVAVYSDGTYYLGEVLSEDTDRKATVSFMCQRGDKNSFMWPSAEDIDTVEAQYVFFADFRVVHSTTRMRSVDTNDWKTLLQKFSQYHDLIC